MKKNFTIFSVFVSFAETDQEPDRSTLHFYVQHLDFGPELRSCSSLFLLCLEHSKSFYTASALSDLLGGPGPWTRSWSSVTHLDGGDGEGDLPPAIDVRVENTKNVLELLRNDQRLEPETDTGQNVRRDQHEAGAEPGLVQEQEDRAEPGLGGPAWSQDAPGADQS